MCYAILRTKYRASAEKATYHEVDTKDQLESKLDELKARPEIQAVTVFIGDVTHRQVTEWRVEDVEKAP